MSQLCVYQLPDETLVSDLQSDVADSDTRLVAPVIPLAESPPLSRLEPEVSIQGKPYVVHLVEMAGVPARLVSGTPVADLQDRYYYDVRDTLDRLFSGF